VIPRDDERPDSRDDVEADRVPRFPQLALEVGDDVDGERDARAREVHAQDGDARAVPGLHRAVRKERVRERVLDFREAALVLVRAVVDEREHTHGALQQDEVEHGRVSAEGNPQCGEERRVRVHLRIGPCSFRARSRRRQYPTHATPGGSCV